MRKLTISGSDLPDHLDDRARFEAWSEAFCTWVGATDLARPGEGAFSGDWKFALAGELLFVRFQGVIRTIERTAAQATAFPQARYFLIFNQGASEFHFSQAGRDLTIEPDGVLLFSGMEPFACRDAASWLGIGVPIAALRRLVPDIESLLLIMLDGSAPSLAHLRQYVGMLLEPGGLVDDAALIGQVEKSLCELVALALGSARENAAIARLSGVRALRGGEILSEISRNFADPNLSVQAIAEKIGVSSSYVQQLLREAGVSFSEHVLELRLQKAHRMLTDRRNDHLKVSEIALACGFNEVSYFNRCFRRRYGEAPLSHRAGD